MSAHCAKKRFFGVSEEWYYFLYTPKRVIILAKKPLLTTIERQYKSQLLLAWYVGRTTLFSIKSVNNNIRTVLSESSKFASFLFDQILNRRIVHLELIRAPSVGILGDVVKLFFWIPFYCIFKKSNTFLFKSKSFLFESNKFLFLMTRFLEMKSYSFFNQTSFFFLWQDS